MNPTICMIAAPRSGTNHLCRVLQNFRALRSYAEIFNPEAAHSLGARDLAILKELHGIDAVSHKDQAVIDFAQQRPLAFLEMLNSSAARLGKTTISFKIFSHHLDWSKLSGEIIERDDVHVVFVLRRAIDSFISRCKAKFIDRWLNVDTTDIKIILDAGEFIEWREGQCRWYSHWLNALPKISKPFGRLTYEDDLACDPSQILRKYSAVASDFGVVLDLPENIKNPGLERQDRSENYADKVANWHEFVGELAHRGIGEDAFDYPF